MRGRWPPPWSWPSAQARSGSGGGGDQGDPVAARPAARGECRARQRHRPVRGGDDVARVGQRDAGARGRLRLRVPREHAPQEHLRVGDGHRGRSHLPRGYTRGMTDDGFGAFRDELIASGLMVDGGVDGLYGRSLAYEEIVSGIMDLTTRTGADEGAMAVHFPPVIPRRLLERTEYLKSFP